MQYTSNKLFRWALACIGLLALLIYLPSLNGMKIWDDYSLIGGQGIGGGDSLLHCFTHPFLKDYFRPLISLSFYLDHMVWKGIPFGYHQTNILFHVCATVLLGLFLALVFNDRRIALLGAALFAVQPVQVSTVAWIGGRTDSQCGVFTLLFCIVLWRLVRSEQSDRMRWLFVTLAAYLAMLMCKEQMIGLLPLIPLAFFSFSSKNFKDRWDNHTRKYAWKVLALFTVASIAFVAAWLTYGPPRSSLERGYASRFLVQGAQTGLYYAELLFLPTPATMHTLCLQNIQNEGVIGVLLGGVIVVGFIALFFIMHRRKPETAWFLAFVMLTLAPVSNLVPLPSLLVAPYRAGVTGLGIAACMGWWFISLFDYVRNTKAKYRKVWKLALSILVGGYLLYTGILTFWGVGRWRDSLTLFSTIAYYDPYSLINQMNLSTALLDNGEINPAIYHLNFVLDSIYKTSDWMQGDNAVTLYRTDPDVRDRIIGNQGNKVKSYRWLGALLTQLGFAYLQKMDVNRSESLFRHSYEICPRLPDTLCGLGDCAFLKHRYILAFSYFNRSVALDPGEIEAHEKLGEIYFREKKWKDARNEFINCAIYQPWEGNAYLRLADTLRLMGDDKDAVYVLHQMLLRNPNRPDALHILVEIQSPHSEMHEKS